MTCSEVRRLLTRFLALELEPSDEAKVRAHLAQCGSCFELAAGREPSLRLARLMAAEAAVEDERFVADVLAGIHQRRVEKYLGRRRRGWLAAAALLLVAAGAWVGVREGTKTPGLVASSPRLTMPAHLEPTPVEVEGKDVRLYQLASPSSGEVQVAFIVDPRLEL
jgi:predicted anti-sigma-YlaC factor YlaD